VKVKHRPKWFGLREWHAPKERRPSVTRPLISPRATVMLRRKTRGDEPRGLN
jgi:hypothetical protein